MLALIVHGRPHRRGISGLPGGGQGHAESCGIGRLFARRALAVEVVHQCGNHQLFFFQQRTTHRFGGMRGEHRFDVDLRQPLRQLFRRHALRLQRKQGVMQAFRLRTLGTCTLVVATTTDAMHALGDVDHLEVGTESTHQRLGIARRTASQLRAERSQRRLAFASGNRRRTHVFHLVEEARRYLFGNQITNQRAKATYIVAQRQVGGGEDNAAAVLVHLRRRAWRAETRQAYRKNRHNFAVHQT